MTGDLSEIMEAKESDMSFLSAGRKELSTPNSISSPLGMKEKSRYSLMNEN